jgi:hypothetical protein
VPHKCGVRPRHIGGHQRLAELPAVVEAAHREAGPGEDEAAESGYDQIYISQGGEDQAGFLQFFFKELRPRIGL